MAHRRVVADTGVFIQYLRATIKEKTSLQNLPDDISFFVTSVTTYELLIGTITEALVTKNPTI